MSAPSLGLMSCVRESSPPPMDEKNVVSKKKFWNRLRWFKRKNKQLEDAVPLPQELYHPKETGLRSLSTSELSIEERPAKKRNGGSMPATLSVSHDSVFHSQQSGSETDLEGAQSVSSLCTQPPKDGLQSELIERLRLRRGRGDTTSEDDEGLPRSPCNSPTTTSEDKTASKDLPIKSDPNEDEASDDPDRGGSSDLNLRVQSVPLNHSAAHHRKSLKPNRTHGLPKRRAQIGNPLPTTVEVNEDCSVKGSFGDINKKDDPTNSELTEKLLKSCSLPIGLAPPGPSDGLNRSKSSASKSHEALESPSEKSFFDRFFLRRSAKKKKKSDGAKYESRPIPVARSGAAYRQRVAPASIPLTPDQPKRDIPRAEPKSPDEFSGLFKNKPAFVLSTSPDTTGRRNEINLPKMKLGGLSSLQQRVLYLNEDEDDPPDFNSLTELPSYSNSHPAKSLKNFDQPKSLDFTINSEEIIYDEVAVTSAPETFDSTDLTILGPSHTAIISIKNEPITERSISKVNIEPVDNSTEAKFHYKKREKFKPKSPTDSPVKLESLKSSTDSLSSENIEITDRSSSDSLDVVLRKKPVPKDEEPELMKVFARRSLKLKDPEGETVMTECDTTPDSDKENVMEERKESNVPFRLQVTHKNEPELTIKKPIFNTIFPYQSVSLNAPIAPLPTKNWCKSEGWKSDDKSDNEETIEKNFVQRKAEWEKRAQEAQRKSTI